MFWLSAFDSPLSAFRWLRSDSTLMIAELANSRHSGAILRWWAAVRNEGEYRSLSDAGESLVESLQLGASMRNVPRLLGHVLKGLAVLALMVVSGIFAFATALTFAMNLGLRYHGNFEYYRGYSTMILIYAFGALGFLAPGVILWNLRNRTPPWQFSLRALLIAMALIAVLVTIYTFSL